MIHVTFSPSAAGSLRQLLAKRGVKERVIELTDDLDLGPISRGDLAGREDWLNRNAPLGFPMAERRDWLSESETRFCDAVEADCDRLIWLAPKSATEQAGFLWFLDRFGSEGAKLIFADFVPRNWWNTEVPTSLGQLGEEHLAELLDEAPRVAWDTARYPADRWQQLIDDNALVRAVQDGVLQSVEDDFFDWCILEKCTTEWKRVPYVMAEAMSGLWDAGHNANIDLLTWRLRKLIESKCIACDADLSDISVGLDRNQHVRLIH